MRKFKNDKVESAEIEIAQAFVAPNVCYMNRYYLNCVRSNTFRC